MNLSLIFNENSLTSEFIVINNTISIVFTVNDITNINQYLNGVPFGTIVSSLSVQNQNGGALLNGSLYYTNNSPIQFTADTITINSNDIIGIIILNFAYLGDIPLLSNNVFGGAKLTYIIPSPYIEVLYNNGNVVLIPATDQLSVDPIIEIFPYPAPCFAKGTNILTDLGYKKIEELIEGDKVKIFKGTTAKIKKIYKYIKTNPKDLYCFNNLYISGNHAIFIGNKIRHIKCLYNCGNNNIKKIKKDFVEYYHIIIDEWENNFIIANDIICETFFCNENKKIKWTCQKDECKYNII